MTDAAPPRLHATYVLPLKAGAPAMELTPYLRRLVELLEVVVVDGSAPHVVAAHAAAWPDGVRHLRPDVDMPNGKVGGVLTGLAAASHDRVVIADDDVRYELEQLRQVVAALDDADVVRPTNHFDPAPWHAVIDMGRTLLNRWAGGDWPGTLAVRRSALPHGYAGDVMFENLELVRTVQAGGGRERVAHDCYVRRVPPTTVQFLDQRVRQAHDEFARPVRLLLGLAVLPATAWAARRPRRLLAGVVATVAAAEAGRRRAGGAAVFPAAASLAAPAWVLERGVCSWLAVWSQLRHGGVRYNGHVLRAATPRRRLRRLFEEAR